MLSFLFPNHFSIWPVSTSRPCFRSLVFPSSFVLPPLLAGVEPGAWPYARQHIHTPLKSPKTMKRSPADTCALSCGNLPLLTPRASCGGWKAVYSEISVRVFVSTLIRDETIRRKANFVKSSLFNLCNLCVTNVRVNTHGSVFCTTKLYFSFKFSIRVRPLTISEKSLSCCPPSIFYFFQKVSFSHASEYIYLFMAPLEADSRLPFFFPPPT